MIAAATPALGLRPPPSAPRLLVRSGGGIAAIGPHGTRRRLLGRARQASFSPDGTLVAFVRGGDLWVANADGTGQRRLAATPEVVESDPAWTRDGRGILYTASVDGRRQIRLFQLPTGPSRRLAAGVGAEQWSPVESTRGRLAFVSSRGGTPTPYAARTDGTDAAPFGPPSSALQGPASLRDLAWSPDGRRLAYTAVAPDGATSIVVSGASPRAAPLRLAAAGARNPVWSPHGARIAYTDADGTLYSVAADGRSRRRLGAGVPLDWRDVPVGRILYPNLVQRPPSGLEMMRRRGRWLLGFTSLVDNRGPGVLWLRARRPRDSKVMQARQLVQVAGGRTLPIDGAGELRFAVAWPHFHWHYLAFDRYELRRAGDFQLVVRDHKEGFCLADHYGTVPGLPHGPPRFRGDCERFSPGARAVVEGDSVGYTDRYPAFYEGQSLDVTGLPAGRYWLVHRANSDFHLRESRYDDDTASLLIRLTWPQGRDAAPRVVALRACQKERCPLRSG